LIVDFTRAAMTRQPSLPVDYPRTGKQSKPRADARRSGEAHNELAARRTPVASGRGALTLRWRANRTTPALLLK
jgi:hypothetical protein